MPRAYVDQHGAIRPFLRRDDEQAAREGYTDIHIRVQAHAIERRGDKRFEVSLYVNVAHGGAECIGRYTQRHVRPGDAIEAKFDGGGVHEVVAFGLLKFQRGVDQIVYCALGNAMPLGRNLYLAVVHDQL